jgi:RNA-binding protein
LVTPQNPAVLTGKQRSYLRALAHPLKPVVQIGHGGLTEAVLAAIEGALLIHELIKVRVTGNDEMSASELAPEVEKRTRSSVAQVIGKTLVVYRGRKKDPLIILPQADGTPGKQLAKPAKTAKTAKASKGKKPPKAAKPGKSGAAGQSGKVSKFVKPSQFGKRSN